MPDNPLGPTEPRPKLLRLYAFWASALYIAIVGLAVAILRNQEWHPHLVRLVGRAWSTFVAEDVGSTSRGFISGSMEAILSIVGMPLMILYLYGWKEFKKHIWGTALIAMFAVPTITLIVYGTQFAWEVSKEVYKDHRDLESAATIIRSADKQSSTDLQEKLAVAQSELDSRKHMLHVGDPAFQNMTNTIRAFMTWRRNIGPDAQCRILVTTPDKEDGGLYMTFITFAVFGSNCPNGDLNNVGVKRENVESETSKGMIPGVVVLHAPPDAKGANQLENELSNLFQVKRAFTIPGQPTDNTIWIQFGTGVKWNTERYWRK
jgi:hypothetical protein